MDEDTLAELIPKVTEQMRSAVGLGTKVGADNAGISGTMAVICTSGLEAVR